MAYESWEIAADRELAKRSFKQFVLLAWHIVEPQTEFKDNWHVDMICERLQGIFEGKYNPNLVINIPPGHMKTLLTGTFFPAWVWTLKPETRFLYVSYNQKQATKGLRNAKRLLDARWYSDRWGSVWSPSGEAWGTTLVENSKTGKIHSEPMTGAITGNHLDFVFVDDPIKPIDARSKVKLEEMARVFNETLPNRLTNVLTSAIIIIMQRLHEEDMAGLAIRLGYDLLCLPVYFDPDFESPGYLKEYDIRKEKEEVLWEERFPESFLSKMKRQLGASAFASQYQQRPVPAEGGIFKVDWFKQYWKNYPQKAQFIQSWDLAFKGTDSSDYVVCQIWAASQGRFYLIDQLRQRLDYPQTKEAIKMMTRKWPHATLKLVEDKANGPAIIDDLKKSIPGLVAVKPRGSKQARASSIAPIWEAGNVYIPNPDVVPWVNDFIHECTVFDKGRYDDQVDAMTQALDRFNSKLRSLANYALNSPFSRFRR